MKTRLQLHELLSSIPGVVNCYFSPPEGVRMYYPCIVYFLMETQAEFADNLPYKKTKKYRITVIDEDPDSEIPDYISDLPCCFSERNYTADGLNHFVYILSW